MDSIEFIQSIYKGENIHECEKHLKGFLKAKVQELIPEHFEEIKKYKELKANSVSALELFESCGTDGDADDDDVDDDDVDESLPEDAKEKITKALKTIKGFVKIKSYEVERNNVAVVKAQFKADLEDDEEVTALKSQISKAIQKQNLKVEFVNSKDSDSLSFEVLA